MNKLITPFAKLIIFMILYIVFDYFVKFDFVMKRDIVLGSFALFSLELYIVEFKKWSIPKCTFVIEGIYAIMILIQIAHTILIMSKNIGESGFGFVHLIPLSVLFLLNGVFLITDSIKLFRRQCKK